MNYKEVKRRFNISINEILYMNPLLRVLFMELFVDSSAYVVGGFLRDIIFEVKPRDLDIIVETNHSNLVYHIEKHKIPYSINRHKGIKLNLNGLNVDIWSTENNWAFRNDLVKLNPNNKLLSIAKGCFYNYDSLVINIHNSNCDISFFNSFLEKNTLEILQNAPAYAILNPTKEANVLRAFYIRRKYNSNFSENTKKYLIQIIRSIQDSGFKPVNVFESTLHKYPKYTSLLSIQIIETMIEEILDYADVNDQYIFKL